MNFAEVVEAVKFNLDRLDVATVENNAVKRWINQAIREDICGIENLPWMKRTEEITTTSSEEFYPIADTSHDEFKDLRFVRFRKSTSNEWMSLGEDNERAVNHHFSEINNGTPVSFNFTWDEDLQRHGIRVRLKPDEDTWLFQIGFWVYPAEMKDDADTNRITQFHSKLLEAVTTARGCLNFEDYDAYRAWQEFVNIEIRKYLQVERSKKKASNMTLRMSPNANRPATSVRSRHRSLGLLPYAWRAGWP